MYTMEATRPMEIFRRNEEHYRERGKSPRGESPREQKRREYIQKIFQILGRMNCTLQKCLSAPTLERLSVFNSHSAECLN